MNVMKAVHPDFGAWHRFEIRNEFRVSIDAAAALGQDARQVHAVADDRYSRQNARRRRRDLAPVRSREQCYVQVWMALEQLGDETERARSEIAPGIVVIAGLAGVHVVDRETDRGALA